MQRDRCADHIADVLCPHSGAVNHVIAGDVRGLTVLFGGDASDATAFGFDVGDFDVLEYLHTHLPRAFGHRVGDIGGVALPVFGQVNGTNNVINV